MSAYACAYVKVLISPNSIQSQAVVHQMAEKFVPKHKIYACVARARDPLPFIAYACVLL